MARGPEPDPDEVRSAGSHRPGGVLIRRPWYFPTLLGILIGVAGVGHLADGLTHFLFPEIAPSTSPYFIAPVVVGELTLCGWPLAKGVRTKIPNT